MQCLSDDDVTIRTRALELLTGMVRSATSKSSSTSCCSTCMSPRGRIGTSSSAESSSCAAAASTATFPISRGARAHARAVCVASRPRALRQQFALFRLARARRYLSVLVTLTHIRGSKHGSLIAEQLVDVTMRVKVRRSSSRARALLLRVRAQARAPRFDDTHASTCARAAGAQVRRAEHGVAAARSEGHDRTGPAHDRGRTVRRVLDHGRVCFVSRRHHRRGRRRRGRRAGGRAAAAARAHPRHSDGRSVLQTRRRADAPRRDEPAGVRAKRTAERPQSVRARVQARAARRN